jgi:hypothetical protein
MLTPASTDHEGTPTGVIVPLLHLILGSKNGGYYGSQRKKNQAIGEYHAK